MKKSYKVKNKKQNEKTNFNPSFTLDYIHRYWNTSPKHQ
jgi:hypothetical protein